MIFKGTKEVNSQPNSHRNPPNVHFQRNKTKKNEILLGRIKKRRYKNISNILSFINKFHIKKFVMLLGFILGILLSYKYIPHVPVFSLEKVDVGNAQINVREDIASYVIEKYHGMSIFKISESDLRSDITSQFESVDNVYVRKSLPNKLVIEIEESYPVAVIQMIDGAYIINDNYEVLSQVHEGTLDIDEEGLKILSDAPDLNSDYLQKLYYDKIEDNQENSWTNFSQEEKQRFFEEVKASMTNKLKEYEKETRLLLENTTYSELPFISFTESHYEEFVLNSVKDRIIFSVQAYYEFSNFEYTVENLKWISNFSLQINYSGDRSVILSIKRDLEDQVEDFEVLIWHNQFLPGNIHDLRIGNISRFN